MDNLIKNLIIQCFVDSGLTNTAFSRKYHMGRHSLQRYMKGTRTPKTETMFQMLMDHPSYSKAVCNSFGIQTTLPGGKA